MVYAGGYIKEDTELSYHIFTDSLLYDVPCCDLCHQIGILNADVGVYTYSHDLYMYHRKLMTIHYNNYSL